MAGGRGTPHAASPAGSGIDQDQSASNDNSTDQGADATAGTRQLNVNAPVSVLSWGANGGDVDQSNDATTTADAKNTNGTDQSVDQDQQAASKGSTGGIDQSQDATNGNETSQDAGADASTKQANVNVPISILSWGANGGDVTQTNAADTRAYAGNANGTDQSVDQNQDAKVDGSKGPGYGNAGSIDQTQSGSNDNTTHQSADASALTKQFNLNAPISILSWGASGNDCGCGKGGDDVVQKNHADTKAYASNDNWTGQSVDQDQDATIVAPAPPAHGHGGYPQPPKHDPKPCGCEHHGPKDHGPKDVPGSGSIDQVQSGYNDNRTDQGADAEATTKQANVNAPISVLGWGANTGSVDQANHAATIAGASNTNGTKQSVKQGQKAHVANRGERGYRPHASNGKPTRDCGCSHPKPVPAQPAAITQTQTGGNTNDTTQNASADATTEQKNVNRPFSFLSWGDDHGSSCGCGGSGYGHGNGGVHQGNDATTKASAGNANETRQTIGQMQEALIGRR